MKIDRLVSIIMILNNNKRVTSKELSEKFQVSVKTIQRDIETIEQAGIPIVSYKGYNGGYGIIDEYKINKSSITKDEAILLENLLKGIDNTYKTKESYSLINKLNAIDDNDKKSNNRLIIDFSTWGKGKELTEKINLIDNCILERKLIEFDYININGQNTLRIVEPHKIVFKALNWYIYGFCTLKKEMRIFKIHRINNIKIKEETFKYREEANGEIFKPINYETTDITLKCSRDIKGLINESFQDYKVLNKDENFITLTISVPYNKWIESMILSFGNKIKVIGPEFLKENIKNTVKNMNELYK